MKRAHSEVLKFAPFNLKNRHSLISFYKMLSKEYKCGELHQNIILNPDEKSSFLYLQQSQDEIIFGFKDTNNGLYQKLVKLKDSRIFGYEQTKQEEVIAPLIKDIKNYSYIEGGALVTFHKPLLKSYMLSQLQELQKMQKLKELSGE
ncbi:conserved Plasmodium protein, unknown function [Plasmodium vivax]|uniref:Uncharacterized protein n=6 Tax=Plasmodium vivax TaxID=5855 RepID=A5K8Z6_PLAVS|nr:hypothetical protein, conserved [Plasmodium vivax]KMZ77577.1 hypothetical protein PVIIG_01546 [Plasmodium vivax India VII]KMZ84737.1 hypothetical protein PVBG_00517 [Plasmodium vivax Brazil I]KMZ90016.1 hypothetical protein PVMG_03577 [Plasmodium vivax Mauritania I]KMZ96573.1 hypothetical protein PVNG_01970 [Plasmodium vivax North Korean]EDL44292.1 hypothetical protein, conserved [Plasmodium vivax]|eukprot:XP_001614019.1 hypothetical protein [Plasmodium vivax Sal-1]